MCWVTLPRLKRECMGTRWALLPGKFKLSWCEQTDILSRKTWVLYKLKSRMVSTGLNLIRCKHGILVTILQPQFSGRFSLAWIFEPPECKSHCIRSPWWLFLPPWQPPPVAQSSSEMFEIPTIITNPKSLSLVFFLQVSYPQVSHSVAKGKPGHAKSTVFTRRPRVPLDRV